MCGLADMGPQVLIGMESWEDPPEWLSSSCESCESWSIMPAPARLLACLSLALARANFFILLGCAAGLRRGCRVHASTHGVEGREAACSW